MTFIRRQRHTHSESMELLFVDRSLPFSLRYQLSTTNGVFKFFKTMSVTICQLVFV